MAEEAGTRKQELAGARKLLLGIMLEREEDTRALRRVITMLGDTGGGGPETGPEGPEEPGGPDRPPEGEETRRPEEPGGADGPEGEESPETEEHGDPDGPEGAEGQETDRPEETDGPEEVEGAAETERAEGTEGTEELEAGTGPAPTGEEKPETPGPQDHETTAARAMAEVSAMTMEQTLAVTASPGRTIRTFLELRGGEPPDCPRCGSRKGIRPAQWSGTPGRYRCNGCNAEFSLKTRTRMHNSKAPLEAWLTAIKMAQLEGPDASAAELSKASGISPVLAGSLMDAVREAMNSPLGLVQGTVLVQPERRTPEHPVPQGSQAPDGKEKPDRSVNPEKNGTKPIRGHRRAPLPQGPLRSLSMEQVQQLAQDQDACARMFLASRDRGGIDCPRCGARAGAGRARIARPGQFYCGTCSSWHSVRKGTAMEGLRIPMGAWLMAAYLVATGDSGRDPGGLAELMNTSPGVAQRVMEIARQTCAGADDPLAALAAVRTEPRRDAPGTGPQARNGLVPKPPAAGVKNGAHADERVPAPVDILSPDG